MDDLLPSDPEYIGRYRLVGRLGGGGMGQVYLARSPGGRSVAVKVIREPLAADPGFRVRFAREIAAARRVSGIFTAPVVDADPDAERPWLVTAYVAGPSLADAVEQSGPLPADMLVLLAGGLAEGLAAIHAVGVVHRDLKPSNVMLAADGPRIIDFGIARASDATALTHAGTVVGSPGFMSPEQAEGRPVGPASDIFSLGSVLTFAATGAGPFGSGQPSTLLYRVVHARPATAGIPAPIRALIERCLAKDPAARPTAESVLASVPPAGAGWRQPATAVRTGGPTVRLAPGPGEPTVPAPASSDHDTPLLDWRSRDRPSQDRPSPGVPSTGTPSRQPRGWPWLAVGAAALLAAVVIGLAGLAGRLLPAAGTGSTAASGGQPAAPAATTAPARRRVAGPRAVVEAYLAAINQRDWPQAWRLGGDNLGRPYRAFVAGFRLTARVVILSLRVSADVVHVRILAYESTGPVQTYALSYLVRHGMIVAGQLRLLGTSG
jgi:serine/threonine protein kinase